MNFSYGLLKHLIFHFNIQTTKKGVIFLLKFINQYNLWLENALFIIRPAIYLLLEYDAIPAKRDLAAMCLRAQARVQLEQLPHPFAVSAASENSIFAACKVANERLQSFAGREVAGGRAPLQNLVMWSYCPAPVPAYVDERLHCLIQLQIYLPLLQLL